MDIPEKGRKHKWVTEAVARKERYLSVWPSPDEMTDEKKQAKFFETITRVGNDPRVINVEKRPHKVHTWMFVFHIKHETP